jgi:RES domain-containing protein
MPRAWRIVAARLRDSAFDGEGARLYGGRWNSPGNALIYVASSRSLAALEMLVHLPAATRHLAMCRFEIEIPEQAILALEGESLPPSWLGPMVHPSTQQLGDKWLRQQRSLALAVPSAVIPEELNYLINPQHPDFQLLTIQPAESFTFDNRLVSTG